MSLFAVSTWISVASVAYSYYNQQQAKSAQKKARRDAERRADLAKGFQFVEEGSAKSLPIVYGRSKIGGVRVHFKVADSYVYYPPATSGLSFESKKQPDNVSALAYVLTNSMPDWSGTWSLNPSSKEAFNANPGWVLTKDDQAKWKRPDRGFTGNSLVYKPPAVDFIYCPFKTGFTNEKPLVALYELGFVFPERPGTVLVLNKDIHGEKKEFYFVQQALAHGGISNVYTIDVDQKPYSYSGYSYGMRVHVYKDGGVTDPMMSMNDYSRAGAQFHNAAYATAAFRLNRDDPQYSGTPELQFYVEGMQVRPIIKSGSTYTLSEEKVYSNNPALVLIDYLTSETHGKALSVSAIDLESFYKAFKICSTILKANVANKGSLALTKGGQRDISLYECNIALDSASSFRDNIQKILDTMGLATLVWSEGKYKLNLPYASLFDSDKLFDTDSVVQITDSGRNRLFRAVAPSTNKYPLTYPSYWAEDVIPDDLKLLNDDDLLLGSELLISWPNADNKLNFATVRFLNEEQNFVEDTISWPEKEPANSNDQIYATFLNEDNNVALEAEIFEAGCTTPYHAKALAEQRVRASRETVTYTFNAVARAFVLEPGDLFGFQSNMFNIPYSILKVEDVETEAGGIVKITASTFDANLLAANVPDEFYSPLRNSFEGYSLKQATDLEIAVGQSNDKTSNYTLTWTKANDNRVSQYLISYTTDTLENITTATKWTELGTTSDDTFELPALNGDFTFTVVSLAANRRRAPFSDMAEGTSWPLLSYTLSSSFLDGFSAIDAVLSNNSHNLFASSTGVVNTYAGSGTTVQCFVGSEPLVHNQLSVSNGTFKVEVLAGDAVNISPGNIEPYSSDPTVAVIQDHSAMIANTAKVVYTISGKTKSGASFTVYKQQSFTKSLAGTDAVYLYIEKSSAVLTKLASSAAAAGTYSTATVVGKRVVGNTVSDWGYVTVTPDNGTEPVLATQGVVTIAPATTAGSSKYTIRLYSDANKTTLLDTEEIPVVFKGDQGVQGIQGIQGIQGATGADGVTYYTWVKYADSPTTGMSNYPDGKLYLGIAYNKTTAVESSVYADYTWSLIKGDQGIQGPAGTDGQTTYTWIKYADTSTGTGLSDSPTGKTYIGIAPNRLTAVESTVAADYNWSLIQGPQGTQGIQGATGADGITYYTWVKYADSPTTGMSDYPDSKLYLGIAYNKTTAVESTAYADYTWSLIKGDQGIQGPAGVDGQTTYTWIKYADDVSGTGLSDSPTDKKYIGIAPNKTTATESATPADYTWALIQGPQGIQGVQGLQGVQGIQGATGADGVTYYTWVKYADSPTTGMSDFPDGKLYLGIAYNKTTATESTTYADYTWSLIKGDQGVQGPAGTDGQTTYTWIKYADTATGTGMSDSPEGKTHIGIAPNKLTAAESTVATDYNWSLVQGPQGAQGIQGPSLLVNPNRALVFTATNGTLDAAQENIVFTATVSGIASPTYVWSFSGFETAPVDSGAATQTITAAQFGTAKSATVTCTVSGLYSVVSTVLRFELNTADPSKAEGALQRAGDSITGQVTFATNGGILAATDADNGVYMGPNGLVGKKAGNTTFAVDTSGTATFGGTLNVASATSGARMEIKNSVIKVYDAAGVLRVQIGDLTA